MSIDNDLQRIARTQQGDTEAFTPLVEKYQPRLYSHIRRRVKDAEIAADLTQEIWLKVLRAIQSYRGTAAFSSWLYRIAENVCIDYFRRQKYNTEPLHLIDENRITETDPCPSRSVERAELRLHLREAIAHLTPLRRRVFLLYYHHELPIKPSPQKSDAPKAPSRAISETPVYSSKSPSRPTWKINMCLGLHECLSFTCIRDIRFSVSV